MLSPGLTVLQVPKANYRSNSQPLASFNYLLTRLLSKIKTIPNLQVLIVSYETFRMHSSKFSCSDSCDLLICDEAHRLKNDQTITNKVLLNLLLFTAIFLSYSQILPGLGIGCSPVQT
jgi:hypothetical protein